MESGLRTQALDRFPESRPEATDRAERDGVSMGTAVRPAGNRLQPVSTASSLAARDDAQTRRLGYWWADRMLQTTHPLQQKMALFWHGHFATHENKVRDYRKMQQQIALFERFATSSAREADRRRGDGHAPVSSTRDATSRARPTKPAREVMELFTMGVGPLLGRRARVRAFTGWYFDDLDFKIEPARHGEGAKTFLGRTGAFDGTDVIRIIFEQPVTARGSSRGDLRFLKCATKLARTCTAPPRRGAPRARLRVKPRLRPSCRPGISTARLHRATSGARSSTAWP
ncbi:MAG: DUF1800 family protein [Vicinamibacterales bacterium]